MWPPSLADSLRESAAAQNEFPDQVRLCLATIPLMKSGRQEPDLRLAVRWAGFPSPANNRWHKRLPCRSRPGRFEKPSYELEDLLHEYVAAPPLLPGLAGGRYHVGLCACR